MIDQFLAAYITLLIKQYYDQPNARAEINAMMQGFAELFDFFYQFGQEFDLDNATGDRLDKIGKIVGIPRTIPNALTKDRFTFEDDPTGSGFGTLFNINFGAPFARLGEEKYTDLQLDDIDYRFFIRAKIAVNQGAAYMVSDDYLSLQDVIETLFSGAGYVLDNYDMTLTLYVPYAVSEERFNMIKTLNLLPKPQGVRYDKFRRGESDSFGFADDIGSRGFGSLFDPTAGGTFVSYYTL